MTAADLDKLRTELATLVAALDELADRLPSEDLARLRRSAERLTAILDAPPLSCSQLCHDLDMVRGCFFRQSGIDCAPPDTTTTLNERRRTPPRVSGVAGSPAVESDVARTVKSAPLFGATGRCTSLKQ